jgi:hypothetical protein
MQRSEEEIKVILRKLSSGDMSVNDAYISLTSMSSLTKQQIINDAIKDAIGSEDAHPITHVIKYMKDVEWKWLGKEVTEEMFRSTMQHLTETAVQSLVENPNEEYTTSSTGGLKAIAYFTDDEKTSIEVEIEFIMDSWYTNIPYKQYQDAK